MNESLNFLKFHALSPGPRLSVYITTTAAWRLGTNPPDKPAPETYHLEQNTTRKIDLHVQRNAIKDKCLTFSNITPINTRTYLCTCRINNKKDRKLI